MNNPLKFKKILVTGGAGFIGSAFIRRGFEVFPDLELVVNLDLFTYAGHKKNMVPFSGNPKHVCIKGDIQNSHLVHTVYREYKVEAVVHFAAESHVDRSITEPEAFINTNIKGTFVLLEALRHYPHIHFHHISTDEVYGSIKEGSFNETSPYRPNSPYAASKAASDHLVRAWGHTYGLSTTISHCSNNYGPCQHEEKFIPRMISHCLQEKPLPVYGQGLNVRDWLYVDDHADAVWRILNAGQKGQVYDIGGTSQKRNIDLLHSLISLVAKKTAKNPLELQKLINFVEDRPGHDFRYAIDSTKISKELGWQPLHSIEQGLEKTINWYVP
jgi:dTDP-glucose 4,6-dehydratase